MMDNSDGATLSKVSVSTVESTRSLVQIRLVRSLLAALVGSRLLGVRSEP